MLRRWRRRIPKLDKLELVVLDSVRDLASVNEVEYNQGKNSNINSGPTPAFSWVSAHPYTHTREHTPYILAINKQINKK